MARPRPKKVNVPFYYPSLFRPPLSHRPGRDDLVRRGVPLDIEPLPAAVAVAPALGVLALGVRAEEQELRPLLVVRAGGRARGLRLAAEGEFRLVAQPAPRALDPEHAL